MVAPRSFLFVVPFVEHVSLQCLCCCMFPSLLLFHPPHSSFAFVFGSPCAVGRWYVRGVHFRSRSRFVFVCVFGCISYMGRLPVLARFVSLTYMFFFGTLCVLVTAYVYMCVCVRMCVSLLAFFFGRVHVFFFVSAESILPLSLSAGVRAAPHKSFPLQVSVVRIRALCLRQEIMEGMVARRGRSCTKAT